MNSLRTVFNMSSKCVAISKCMFEHIKSGEPCPLTGQTISQLELDFDSWFHVNRDNISPLLAKILDDSHGTEEMVKNRRKVKRIDDYTRHDHDRWKVISLGSRGDGFEMYGSDHDEIRIKTVVVTYPDQAQHLLRHSSDNTILFMRPAGLRPGYVSLEIARIANGEGKTYEFQNAIVPVGDSLFLSSDMYRQSVVDLMSVFSPGYYVCNGPCSTTMVRNGHHHDFAIAFPCVCWPREANEWIYRTRLHGWPTQAMVLKIVQDGCHIVPVGDKCSTDTLLQWRISFACAEQQLVHSLKHPQFRVYGLLKYFLKQIKGMLDHLLGDDDILCSYFLKTIIFYAVENSPHSLWVGKNTFLCFRFCLAILIAWVRSGHCPNYFIRNNNMFLRKVHGKARQKLSHFLIDLYNLKLLSLTVESAKINYIGCQLQEQELHSRLRSECLRDIDLFLNLHTHMSKPQRSLHRLMKCLKVAHTDIDVFIAFRAVASVLSITVVRLMNEFNRRNKQKYVILKKCSNLLKPKESGMLLLASFYYLTGNYRKTLRLCSEMMSSFRLFIHSEFRSDDDRYFEPYERLCCGKEKTLWHKFQEGVYFEVIFDKENIVLCPSHLHMEVTKRHLQVLIPPLPYAIFLSFLCYHEVGDFRRRDTELMNLQAVNYDPYQGGHEYWVVHTLLGICYQTVGDNRKAIRSFINSLRVEPDNNPAKDRLDVLWSSR